MKKRPVFAILLLCGLMGGCARHQQLGGPAVTVADGSDLPSPQPSDLSAESRAYLIGPYDKLRIDVFGVQNMNDREVQVDGSGRVSFPLAGVLEASGKTPGILADEIAARLRGKYIRDPQVTVNLIETVSQVITVDGQVAKPGLYPVIGKMTLVRAVAGAGGLTDYAKLDDVVVFRTIGGKRYVALYNLQAIRRGVYPDPDLYASDLIVVGDSPGRRLFRDVLQSAPLLTTPLILLLQ